MSNLTKDRTNWGHGHVRKREDGTMTECGGLAACGICREEYAEYHGSAWPGVVLKDTTETGDRGDDYTDLLRHAGRVRRYHTWAVHHYQTVGEHQWQVLRVFRALWLGGAMAPAEVADYVLNHDVAELVVGDPPFPVKASDPELKTCYERMEASALDRLRVQLPALGAGDRARVKVADLVEMMEFGMTEREMGNLLAVPIVLRTETAALKVADSVLGHAARVLVKQYCDEQWVRHERVLRAGDVAHSYSLKFRRT